MRKSLGLFVCRVGTVLACLIVRDRGGCNDRICNCDDSRRAVGAVRDRRARPMTAAREIGQLLLMGCAILLHLAAVCLLFSGALDVWAPLEVVAALCCALVVIREVQ